MRIAVYLTAFLVACTHTGSQNALSTREASKSWQLQNVALDSELRSIQSCHEALTSQHIHSPKPSIALGLSLDLFNSNSWQAYSWYQCRELNP